MSDVPDTFPEQHLYGCTAIVPTAQEEVRTEADDAWDALNASLRELLPPCDQRALFTLDRLSDDHMAECASICERCPVRQLCDAYATAARPQSGFWAGRFYSPKGIITAPGGSRPSTERQHHE